MSKRKEKVGVEEGQFQKAYAALNTAQKEAVDTIEGPVMVIAGPGTGKTQILTLRIANILLETDTKPENILALTFTESGARAMRERLRSFVGSAAYRVNIYTFHGFAESLIRNYPDAYTRVIGGRPATELEKIELIESILESSEYKLLRPSGDPSYYISHILRMFSSLKQEYMSPDQFATIIGKQETELKGIEKIHQKGAHKGKVRGEYTKKEKSIEKNRELLSVYRAYEALLSQRRLYDFDDMITETVRALETHDDMLRDLQETFQYLLADEHQDVNGSQNRILELLASYHDAPNIFVVGDEKQAIYRFQGASLENFLYFEEKFPGTKTISLTENYRSGQTILDAAHSLIHIDEGPAAALRVPLTAAAVPESTIEERHFSHQAVEDAWVVEAVATAITSGTEPEAIAVIVRTNREVEALTRELRKHGIVAAASADGDVLAHPITHQVLALIEAVVESGNEHALFTVLHGVYWGIPHSDVVKILAAQNYSTSLQSILESETVLKELGVADVNAAQCVITVLQEARRRESAEAPHRVLEYVLRESGFLAHAVEIDPYESARVIRRLYDEVEAMVVRDGIATLAAVRAAFTKSVAYNLSLTAPFIATSSHAVQVMTAHKSKGLEFDTVLVPHLSDTLWGGSTRRTYFDIPLTKHIATNEFDAVDDERRLLYVAMTRAKRTLLLSVSDTNAEGKELTPSRLFEDIDAEYRAVQETESHEAAFSPVGSLMKDVAAPTIPPSFLEKVLKERGLSATALNNYLKSPWTYLYRNVLRIPEVQPLHMQFGTAMHNTMEKVTAYHTHEGSLPSATQIKDFFEAELSRLPISKEEYARRHEQGFAALIAYTTHIAHTLPKQTEEEMSIRVTLETGIDAFPELTLTGKLDRLDFDESGKVARIIDYKTGKPKTRNAIEGKTASSDGGYKRQLVFYALLLSLYGDERYLCRDATLAFLEPDAKGVIHEETYTITDEEIESLKAELIRVAKEIISGECLSAPCDPKESEYCHLVGLLGK